MGPGAHGPGALAAGELAAAVQDEPPFPRARRRIDAGEARQDPEDRPRSRRISEEAVVGSSVAWAPDSNEGKSHALILVIEHVFKEDDEPSQGFPVTRVKEYPVKPAVKLAIAAISGFEIWFGNKDQEYLFAKSREGMHAALEADLGHGKPTVKVRANGRRANRVDHEWAWRCHVGIQCFGES